MPVTQGGGTSYASLAAVPVAHSVATSTGAGWTTYESINQIQDLAFAPDGTLWAATGGGLVHWDLEETGLSYSRYPLHASVLAVAPDNSVWLGLGQGVCRFDGTACAPYTPSSDLAGNDVYAITVTPDGIVWVGTGHGVSRFDGSSWKSYPSSVTTHDLAVTTSGEIWAASAGGVGRYLLTEDAWVTYTEEHGLPNTNVQAIAAGPDDEVWAYVLWEGVYRFDGAVWQHVEGTSQLVADIAFAADGTPWIASAGSMHYPGGSLLVHDGQEWHEIDSGQGVHSFRSIAIGPGNRVAASTQFGLGLYQDGKWRLLRDGPTSDQVTSIAITPPLPGGAGQSQDRTDYAVWFAFGDNSVSTPGWGLSRFDGQTWAYDLGDAEVGALAVGPDGILWAGVGCGVQRFDGATWEVVASCDDLPAGNILDIACTPDGAVWVVNGFGLARVDAPSQTVYEKLVHDLHVAPDGALWMNGWEGTENSSYVARFDGETWTTFPSAESVPGRFSVAAVTADGLLWGTTPEGKLAAFDGRAWTKSTSWTLYDIPDSHTEKVAVLAADPLGALWLAVDKDVVRFDRERTPDKAWQWLTRDNGLPASHYRHMAFGPNGEVWFGATRFKAAQTD